MTLSQIGLSPEQQDELFRVFACYPEINEVLVYGSRAKGNYHERSDLDLEETSLPISFDVLDYQEINNPMLKDRIDRVGRIFYSAIAHRVRSH